MISGVTWADQLENILWRRKPNKFWSASGISLNWKPPNLVASRSSKTQLKNAGFYMCPIGGCHIQVILILVSISVSFLVLSNYIHFLYCCWTDIPIIPCGEMLNMIMIARDTCSLAMWLYFLSPSWVLTTRCIRMRLDWSRLNVIWSGVRYWVMRFDGLVQECGMLPHQLVLHVFPLLNCHDFVAPLLDKIMHPQSFYIHYFSVVPLWWVLSNLNPPLKSQWRESPIHLKYPHLWLFSDFIQTYP